MTNMEIKALDDAGRTSMVWSPEGYDGQTHYGAVLRSLVPSLLILMAVVALMMFVL
ncbi:hypothetical protein [uncultured Devosia sp.]|uniref:hypothetical protein n=1 Tax=uncultured Devosia sp. TaxID=211434 RepID=UPI0035C9D4E5